MGRLILHAGTHKTGTTSIQRVLSSNRDELRDKHLLWYPDPAPFLGGTHSAHHRLAHAVAGEDDLEAARAFVDHLVKEQRPKEAVVLSSEAVYRHVLGATGDYWQQRRRYLAALADLLSCFTVEVLLFLRRPDSFAESLYSELVIKGSTRHSFARYLARKSLPMLEQAEQIEALRDVFGTVSVQPYGATAEGAVGDFAHVLDVQIADAGTRTRRSPDPRVVLWLSEQEPDSSHKFFAWSSAADLWEDRVSLWHPNDRVEYLRSFTGPYGASFFPPPAYVPGPATLGIQDRTLIARAYASWCHG